MRVNILERSSAIPWVLRGRNFISAIADWIHFIIDFPKRNSLLNSKN